MDNETQVSKLKWYDNKTTVIVLLFLFFPVGLFALWKSGSFSKVAKWGLTALFAFLVILGAITEEPESTATKSTSKPQTPEQLIEHAVIKAMGKTVNWDGKPNTFMKARFTKQIAGEDEGGYLVDIEYRANDNITVGFIRKGILSDAQKLIEKLSKTPELSEVKIYMLKPHMNLVDKYGNEKSVQVGKIVLRKAVADKINFKNMYPEAFEMILVSEGQLLLHPAMNK